MSQRSRDKSLFEICNFVIQRSDNFFEDCREGLLKSIIFKAGNPEMDADSILKRICEETGLENFPKHTVENIINSLCEKEEICKEGGKYFLKEEEFEKIAEILRRRKDILENVNSKIVTGIKRKNVSDTVNLKVACRIFQNFISDFISYESNFIMDVLLSRKNIRGVFSPVEILDTALNEVKDAKFREIIRRSIVETIESLNGKFIRLLYEAILSLICLKAFSADPSGSIWKKDGLSGKTFILDTNILFPLFLPDHPQHSAAEKIISIAKKLGVRCMFTRRTIQEWFEVLEKANQRFRFLNSTRPSLLKEVEDIFIYSFFKRREMDSSLTWREYYSQMRQVENLARLSGIQIYMEKEEDISDAEGLRIIEHLSAEVYRSGRRRLDVRFIKSRRVSEHDAYHLFLVRRLREESPSKSLGPSYWFLTYDVSLLEADKALNVLLKSPHAVPSSLLVDTWVLLSSLFICNSVELKKLAGIFIDLFRAYFAMPLGKLSASMVVEVLSPYLPYRSLSDDDLRTVLNDEYVKRLYYQLREVRLTSPEKARLIYDRMRRRVDSMIWRLLENRAKETGIS